jgi:PAS domain S-box-containing protein
MAMFAGHPLKEATLDAMAAVSDQIAAGIERKRAEKSLQFTQFTIDHVATPVLWLDSEGRFFNVNDAACRLTGYTREELLSLSVSDVDTRISRTAWPDVWKQLQLRGAVDMESYLRRKDGNTIPISIASNLLKTDDRECSCTFLHDITERKEAERVQRENDLRFRAIYNQLHLQIERMPLAYILFDADLRVIDWNPAAERIFGYLKDEVLGMGPPFEKILPESARSTAEDVFRRIQMGDMKAHSVNDNLTKDGRTITCEWLNTPLQSDDGRFAGVMCLAQDVTERKRLEEQFRQAQKMEAVGALAGGVAHEFNNLLQAICGYTKLAIDGLSPDEQRYQDLQLVLTSADRATVLTRQLLSFGRRQVLQRTHIDPNQAVADLLKMLRPVIGENIDVHTQLSPSVSSIYADPGQLQQVLLNLCINARDAMPRGGRLIIRSRNVSLSESFCAGHRGSRPGPHVLLSVADTGCGMSADVKARIFEPFFTTKELGKGTGLGLAMVYAMVEQHEGIISVYSEPNLGTAFKIYLPARDAADSTNADGPLSDTTRRGTETILIAEDESMVRELAVRILTQAGYSVLVAGDGMEAVEIFEDNADRISLVLLDAVMPRLTGHEAYDQIKFRKPDLPVVFCSGHDPETRQVKLLVDAGVQIVQKPFDSNVLLRVIREMLDAPRRSEHAQDTCGV